MRRDGRTLTKRVRRATVSVPVVEREGRRAVGRRVAHITLSAFTAGAHEQLADEVKLSVRAAGYEP